MKKSYFSKEETVPMELASCCIIKTINNLLIESQVPPNIMYEIDTTIFSFGKNYQEYKELKPSVCSSKNELFCCPLKNI